LVRTWATAAIALELGKLNHLSPPPAFRRRTMRGGVSASTALICLCTSSSRSCSRRIRFAQRRRQIAPVAGAHLIEVRQESWLHAIASRMP